MLRVVVLAAAVNLPTMSVAQNCQQITDDTERLACYDSQFPIDAAVSETPEVETKWQTRVDRSAIDDSRSVYITLDSNEIAQCGFSDRAPATLLVRCVENTTSMIISSNCHMTSGFGRYGDVTMRIDDGSAFTRAFTESTNNRALGLWNGSRSIPLIRQLMEGDRLVARFTPFSDNPVELTFDIAGLDEEIGPLRDACNW